MAYVFVVYHSENNTLCLTILSCNLLAEVFPTSYVMSRITNGERSFTQCLPATKKSCCFTHISKTSSNAIDIINESKLTQLVDSVEYCIGILLLIIATKFAFNNAVCLCFIMHNVIFFKRTSEYFRVVFCENDGSVCCFCLSFKHLTRLVTTLSYYNWHARFYNACFLSSYLCQGVAKELCMVVTYVSDNREQWRDNVCTIESASQTDLNNRNVHLLFGEIFEGKSRCEFKERGM